MRRTLAVALPLAVAAGFCLVLPATPAEPDAGGPAKARHHWAFEPVRSVTPPADADGWSANPIDNFIRARLEKEGLRPSPEAGRPTLIRRLYLDVLGLPPAPEEVQHFAD